MVSVAVFFYNPDEDDNMDLISGRKNKYIVIQLVLLTLYFYFTLFLNYYFQDSNDIILMFEKLFYNGFCKFDMGNTCEIVRTLVTGKAYSCWMTA